MTSYPTHAQFPPEPVQHTPLANPEEKPKTGPLSIATFVLSPLAFGLPAVILGVFALRQNWANGYRGNALAWAGIIIGAVHWVVAFGLTFFVIKAFTFST